jgi:hypothetical protein
MSYSASCSAAIAPRIDPNECRSLQLKVFDVIFHLIGGNRMDEQFSEPEPNVIESTEGFSIKVLGRTGLRYTEGARSVSIDSEVLAKPRAILMYKETIRTWEGPEPEEVSAKDRDRIANNINRAFEAREYELRTI